MKLPFNRSSNKSGYTLIETLVASAIMMIAVGGAASLSLTMVTQEEIAERTVRAANYLENAATLYRLGFDTTAEIQAILPDEPVVTNLTVTVQNETLALQVNAVAPVADVQITFSAVDGTSRTQSVRILRDDPAN